MGEGHPPHPHLTAPTPAPLEGSFCSETHGAVGLDEAVIRKRVVYEGHGRVSLSDGLAFQAAAPALRLEVPGISAAPEETDEGEEEEAGSKDDSTLVGVREPILERSKDVHRFCFVLTEAMDVAAGTTADASYPVQVTVAWTDAPTSPAASRYLAANLDLVVEMGRTGRFTGAR